MSSHNLENDLRELAENIDHCAIGTWWNLDKGCGCPMTELILRKEIATEDEIENTYMESQEVWYLEPRLLNYYPDNGKMIRMFPFKFDQVFDEVAEKHDVVYSSIQYSDDRIIIKEAIIAAIEEVKSARIA